MIPLSEEEKAFVFKIVVVGNGGVGKTSLIKQYTEGNFQNDYIKTIGAQFSKYIETFKNDAVKLFFWDIAGQPEFKFMRPTFYQGAKAGILVFSLTDNDSFNDLIEWYENIKSHCGDIPVVMFGNKDDLKEAKDFDDKKIDALKKDINFIKYSRTSAKTGENVYDAFRSIIKHLYALATK